ncbi:DUF927 domain-containing protein [Stenotrophomonas maltophilia]|uniref:DUF927 domain-containing protein n=1 Tax=Stenotrophomonas maltophilia TaxID=40324 RepID=UPI001F5BB21C|nr:DUF927 domain-containing protein [Stenotrophomonas maltophilia]
MYLQSAMRVHAARCGSPYHYAAVGSLDDWRRDVARRCQDNSRLVLAVSAMFAGPLLHFTGATGGGFHLVGGSSSGKSTALRVAASVVGPPEYAREWRSTANGLEGVAVLHNDATLILDELAQIDPKQAGDAAYLLANGKGKSRANRAGEARAAARWRVLILSAGEVGLAQHMAEVGKQASPCAWPTYRLRPRAGMVCLSACTMPETARRCRLCSRTPQHAPTAHRGRCGWVTSPSRTAPR